MGIKLYPPRSPPRLGLNGNDVMISYVFVFVYLNCVYIYMQVYALPFNLHVNFYFGMKIVHFDSENVFL